MQRTAIGLVLTVVVSAGTACDRNERKTAPGGFEETTGETMARIDAGFADAGMEDAAFPDARTTPFQDGGVAVPGSSQPPVDY